ncbi:hypothetical protein AQUCO_04700065v1 [Aquilegia coerulea]|uniref:Uncharacterized protein n=1 Tax=Aquilegia coerulea TaxID=218851 RepID=A0A2G5CKV0_AQUCA|nr:hypothetical protein AQUCO_04700065v1 [Aquilegia coerulea]
MVISLRPARFYGSSLPRPQFYTDVKYSEHRVDPPESVLDPLLSWAKDAHWSMGGLNFKRIRHQGRIEGNIKKLRAEGEKKLKNGLIQVKIERARVEEEKRVRKNGGIAGRIEKLRREAEEEDEVEEEMMVKTKKVKRKGKEAESAPVVVTTVSASPAGSTRSKRRRLVLGNQDESVPDVSATTASGSPSGSTRSKRRKLVLRDEDEEEIELK